VRLKRQRRDELGELAGSLNAMAQGLKQRDLIKNLFGKVLDPRIVERYVADPTEAKPGGERRVQSVLFSDLQGFTTVAERLPAQDLVRLLNGYLEDAERAIAAEDGLLDKFVGDGVMAFWGPPFHDRHAGRACRAALRLSDAAARQADACRALGVPPLAVRVGVATGEVVVGNVGSANHFGYTVLGDVANLGSRLEGLNKLYRTSVLVDTRTAKEAADVVVTRRVDRVRVVGRSEPVDLHEVMTVRGDAAGVADEERLRDAYEAALALYDARDFEAARRAFDALAEAGDATSHLMAARCVVVAEWDRAGEWDGVWNAESK
jgi:adenylate cyclase